MSVLFRIGARGSKLSLAQTEQTRARLAAHLGVALDRIEIVPIVTSGDRIQDRRLLDAGGKGLFTKELDEALIDNRIDLAIHSLKDLPTELPGAINLACVPEREDPRDAFVSAKAHTLQDLPRGSVIGTASLRRAAQSKALRPDLDIVTLRGNVDTRLKKLEDGVADATFLALAGLKRIGLQDRATSIVNPEDAPPAPCQGALAITARSNDPKTRGALAGFENTTARLEIELERAFLAALDGSCHTAIGALARIENGAVHFIGEALAPDGSQRWRRVINARVTDANAARELGRDAGEQIRDEAGDAFKAS